MEPTFSVNPASYAAAMQSARIADELQRQTEELKQELWRAEKQRQIAEKREDRRREEELLARELEFRGLSPLTARNASIVELRRRELVEGLKSLTHDLVRHGPRVSESDYELMRQNTTEAFESQLPKQAVSPGMAGLWVAAIVGSLIAIGTGVLAASEGSQGSLPYLAVALALVLGSLAVILVLLIMRAWRGRYSAACARRLKSEQGLIAGIPTKNAWFALIYEEKLNAVIAHFTPLRDARAKDLDALDPSILDPDDAKGALKTFDGQIATYHKQLKALQEAAAAKEERSQDQSASDALELSPPNDVNGRLGRLGLAALSLAIVVPLIGTAIGFNSSSSQFQQIQTSQRLVEARDTLSSIATLNELAGDPSDEVRLAVAANPSTPPEGLLGLARDTNPQVRLAVAKNPMASEEVLDVIAADRDSQIRLATFMRPDLSEASRNVIATMADEAFLSRASRYFGELPTEKLVELVLQAKTGGAQWIANSDVEPKIRAAALSRSDVEVPTSVLVVQEDPDILAALAGRREENLRRQVAFSRNAAPETLQLLASDPAESVRRAVAENINISTETIELLASDQDRNVRRRIAQHPNTSRAVLQQLANDDWEPIRKIAQLRL